MSHYYTRWCKDHGDYDEDVDNPGECPTCEKLGIAPSQLLEKRLATLEAIAKAVVIVADEAKANGGKITLVEGCALFVSARRAASASEGRA